MKKISTWWRRVRIYPDSNCGFEVQVKYIWWPFWVQAGFFNTHISKEKAYKWAAYHFRAFDPEGDL